MGLYMFYLSWILVDIIHLSCFLISHTVSKAEDVCDSFPLGRMSFREPGQPRPITAEWTLQFWTQPFIICWSWTSWVLFCYGYVVNVCKKLELGGLIFLSFLHPARLKLDNPSLTYLPFIIRRPFIFHLIQKPSSLWIGPHYKQLSNKDMLSWEQPLRIWPYFINHSKNFSVTQQESKALRGTDHFGTQKCGTLLPWGHRGKGLRTTGLSFNYV